MVRTKRKKKKTKKDVKKHFQVNWNNRVGYDIPVDIEQLNNMVQGKEKSILKFLKKQSNAISQYTLDIDGRKFKVIYNKNLNCVVTIFEID